MSESFKDTIYEALKGHGVKYITVERNADIKGSPATHVMVFATDRSAPHEFTFAKANLMSAEHIAAVIKSYLRNRT